MHPVLLGCRALAATVLVVACLLWPALSIAPAQASAPAEAGKRTDRHFNVPEPATKDEAVSLLQGAVAKIEQSLASADFDSIHEATYSVEAALTRMAKEPGYDGITATASPRCEIVHLASEMHDAETVKAAVPLLVKSLREQFLIK